jgi:hypothetical protein
MTGFTYIRALLWQRALSVAGTTWASANRFFNHGQKRYNVTYARKWTCEASMLVNIYIFFYDETVMLAWSNTRQRSNTEKRKKKKDNTNTSSSAEKTSVPDVTTGTWRYSNLEDQRAPRSLLVAPTFRNAGSNYGCF